MKKKILIVIAVFFAFTITNKVHAQASKIVGMWKTIDDDTGEAKSYVKIYKAKNGFYYGKITKLLLKRIQRLLYLKRRRIFGL